MVGTDLSCHRLESVNTFKISQEDQELGRPKTFSLGKNFVYLGRCCCLVKIAE